MSSFQNSLRNLYLLSLLYAETTAQYTPAPRWGQASALVNDVLLVYGGKTDQYNQYSYTSAPNNNDLLKLSLSASFDLASPPWEYIAGSSNSSTSQGPSIAWHSLSAYNTSQSLLFGGDPGPNSNDVLPALPNSANILNIYDQNNPAWIFEPQSWANQPSRRIHHSASSTGGKIWIIGGEKADGSNNAISQHEVFDPQSSTFAQLPSDNGPPDIYGHTSIVLSNGSLVVFGGYSESLASMIPLSTVWMLDTTSNNIRWSLLPIDNSSLPTPRRAFAATELDSGMILIHGGADATLETTYSDGWILDTTRTPMVWSAVEQLLQLGARRDHFAVAIGHAVFFAFGYSSSGPAAAGISLYDSSSSSWSGSFTPNASPVNTLPPFTQTNTITHPTGYTGTSGRSTYSNGSPTSSSDPTTTPGRGSNGSSKVSKKTAIVLGAVFGFLGLVAVVGCGIYYFKRQHQHETRFHMLGDHEDGDNPNMGRAIPVAGIVVHRPPLFGFVSRAPPIQRRDMLADEDSRHFNISNDPRRDASGQSSINSHAPRKPPFSIQSSLASLRSVGGLLGVSAVARDLKSRHSSQSSKESSWDEKGQDRFSDHAALVSNEQPALGFERRRKSSCNLPPAIDPFSDMEVEECHDGDSDAHSIHMEATFNERAPYVAEAMINTAEICPLPSIGETSSHQSSLPHNSSESFDHTPQSGYTTHGSSSHSSDEFPRSPSTRRSSIIDANPSQPMRRSDSWWIKFAKTPFLDRRSSDATKPSRFVEFRDPNPPPRLVAIEEGATIPSRPTSCLSKSPSVISSPHHRMYSKVGHDRSLSSLQTAQTADSEVLERIGSLDIVQRDLTMGSGNIYGGRPLSAVMCDDTSGLAHEARSSLSGDDDISETAEVRWFAPLVGAKPTAVPSPSGRAAFLPGARSPPPKPRPSGGMVASRVQAFEQRLSIDGEASKPPTPDEKSTKHREVLLGKHRDRSTVKYGFAPRPSLFVANPDRKSPSGDS